MPRGEPGQPGRVAATKLNETFSAAGLEMSESLVECTRQLLVWIRERTVADGLFFLASDQREFQYDIPARSSCPVLSGEVMAARRIAEC